MRRRHKLAVSLMSFPIAWSGGSCTVVAQKANDVGPTTAPSSIAPSNGPGPDHETEGPTTTIPEPEAPLVTLPPGLGPTTTEPVEQSGGTPFPASSPSRTPAAGPASSTVPDNSIARGPLPVATESGLASWYDTPWGGLTTASRDYAKGTQLRVCHGGGCVLVTVNDYGPQAWTGRSLDLSSAAFAALAPLSRGVIAVTWAVA